MGELDMSKWMRYPTLLLALAVTTRLGAAQDRARVTSPDGRNAVTVEVRDGALTYSLDRDGRALLLPSRLGFAFQGAPPLRDSLRMVDTSRSTADETWTQPWGEFAITDELTEFALADDARAWWIPSNRPRLDRSEMLFSSSPVSVLDSVQTPLTMETRDGRTFIVIHEANLVDYARMFLTGPRMQSRTLRAALAPYADGIKVRGRTPFVTPWRTIQLADRATDLAPSLLGLNLNPPSVIQNTSWIKPMKYVGIWWGMHIGTMTWSSGAKHGATTANTKRYIDFAAANGLGGVLVEGWNVGWDGDWIQNRNAFSFTQAYPDYDLVELARYAHSKGVKLIVHNETSGGIENYERQMDSAFALYQSLGLDAIKSGYVTDTITGGHSHWSQRMVQHYRHVIEKAAQYHIMLDVHEPIQDTGERRTYPNMMSREGARGQEYNAWGGEGGNPPEHETILFFTRLLDGPMDFTPGIFDILRTKTGPARTNEESRVRTTLAKQLALYVVIYSPLQMAADLPENYVNQPAFQFIKDVAVDWDTSRVIDGKIGDYVIVARKQRNSPQWFLGAITDEEARTFNVPLTFLDRGERYSADIYADGPGANGLTNPLPVAISHRIVTRNSVLHIALAPGGGQAIRIQPVQVESRSRRAP